MKDELKLEKDERIKVVPHAHFNKTLVAAQSLCKGEILLYWGRVCDTVNDYTLRIAKDVMIDPSPFADSLLQFANAPGKDEVANIVSFKAVYGKHGMAGYTFHCVRNIPQNHQILLNYGKGWFESRGIERKSTDLPNYPATKRRLCQSKRVPELHMQLRRKRTVSEL